jgi:D-alanyl-lipoteichoic acid acyltransferase DltB (MBOAT superfamily)
MLFNSLPFLVFLPVVVAVYYALPHAWRWLWLLAASVYFYMSFVPMYIVVLGALIAVDYALALVMEAETRPHIRKQLLAIAVGSNFALLFIFKYFNFFNANVGALAHWLGWNYSVGYLYLLLPLGLSFHTFQCVSYLVEVYRGRQKAERHLGIYALFVMFFPQLVAGPIERASHLLPQFYAVHTFDATRMWRSIELIAWGFFMKIAVADRAALVVDAFYKNPSVYPGWASAMAIVFFSFQMYGDFAGYTNIARGAAGMLGFDLIDNFNHPFLSRSISEFWHRWHISLSSWLRDYVYTPVLMLFNRVSIGALYAAVIITFLASGIWHGAGWTFVGMGLWFGLVIVFELATRTWRAAFFRTLMIDQTPWLYEAIEVLITFCLATLGWVFFRAPDLATVVAVWSNFTHGWTWANATTLSFGYESKELITTAALIGVLVAVDVLAGHGVKMPEAPATKKWFAHGLAFSCVVLLTLVFGEFNQTAFIYFQF